MCCGADKTEILKNWANPKIVKSVFGMGDAEAQAVIALCTRIPREARNTLAKVVMKHGMVRGPVSHAGIGCESMRVGWGPECLMREWTVDMQNAEGTVILIAQRVCQDFENRPVSLRKPAGPSEITHLQKICRVVELCLMKFRSKVSEENYNKHKDTFVSSFMTGCLDTALIAKFETGTVQWDVDDMPDFGAILLKEASEIHRLHLERSANLRAQVLNATFAECRFKVLEDRATCEKYLTARRASLNDWQNTVLLHKRRRYAAGQKAIAAFAKTKLDFRMCDMLHGATAEISAFKQDFESGLDGKTPCLN